MNDLISRSALLEKVERVKMRRDDDDLDFPSRAVALYYIETAPAVDAAPKWISVKDRLPDSDIPVLIAYKTGVVYMGYYDAELVEWDGMDDAKIVRPAYWMPLPEPPES